MGLKKWEETKLDKWKTVWTKGNFKPGYGYPDWIHVQKTSLIGEWEVGARKIINKETINGHFKFFNSKAKAMTFAKSYMKRY